MFQRQCCFYLLTVLLLATCLNACQSVEQTQTESPANATAQLTSTCTDPRSQVCTMDFNPVCALRDTGVRCVKEPCDEATEWKTFANGCTACGDEKVFGHVEGACEESDGD